MNGYVWLAVVFAEIVLLLGWIKLLEFTLIPTPSDKKKKVVKKKKIEFRKEAVPLDGADPIYYDPYL